MSQGAAVPPEEDKERKDNTESDEKKPYMFKTMDFSKCPCPCATIPKPPLCTDCMILRSKLCQDSACCPACMVSPSHNSLSDILERARSSPRPSSLCCPSSRSILRSSPSCCPPSTYRPRSPSPLCCPKPGCYAPSPLCCPPPRCSPLCLTSECPPQCSPKCLPSRLSCCSPTCSPTSLRTCPPPCPPLCPSACTPTCTPMCRPCSSPCQVPCSSPCGLTRPPLCLPTCPPSNPPACTHKCPPMCLPTCSSTCPPSCPPACTPTCPPMCLPACSSTCPPSCPPACTPTCPPMCSRPCPPPCKVPCSSPCVQSCSPSTCSPNCMPACQPFCRPFRRYCCSPLPKCPEPCCQPPQGPMCAPPACSTPTRCYRCCDVTCYSNQAIASCSPSNTTVCVPPPAHACPSCVDHARPEVCSESVSGQGTWEMFGVRIKWTEPAAPGCCMVVGNESIIVKLCVEVNPSSQLTPDAIRANCWTHMKTMCNPCGEWKDLPMNYVVDASSVDECGIYRYVYSCPLTPLESDTYKLTFNVRFNTTVIWAYCINELC